MWWLWDLTAEQKRRALLGSSLLLIVGALYLLTDTKSCCAGDADIPLTGHAPPGLLRWGGAGRSASPLSGGGLFFSWGRLKTHRACFGGQ